MLVICPESRHVKTGHLYVLFFPNLSDILPSPVASFLLLRLMRSQAQHAGVGLVLLLLLLHLRIFIVTRFPSTVAVRFISATPSGTFDLHMSPQPLSPNPNTAAPPSAAAPSPSLLPVASAHGFDEMDINLLSPRLR